MDGLLTGMRRTCGLAGVAVVMLGIAACGGGSGAAGTKSSARQATSNPSTPSAAGTTSATGTTRTATATTQTVPPPLKPPPPPYPRLLGSALSTQLTAGFVPVGTWQGQTSAWIARLSSGVALLAFNQRLVQLDLHSGTTDAGTSGWHFGPSVSGSEARHLVAAFNGGFKFSVGAGGFMSYGHVAVPLRDGIASVVTYADGVTDIGAWGSEVPARGRHVVSVRQNLPPLIDGGHAAASLDCLSCWGATLGGVADPARSALGITADGRLVWAGGEHLTASALADTLLGARVVRAIELDINPFWVAGYLYGHRGGKGPLAPVPVVPGQNGISGQYLAPWSRDFFTVVTRPA